MHIKPQLNTISFLTADQIFKNLSEPSIDKHRVVGTLIYCCWVYKLLHVL